MNENRDGELTEKLNYDFYDPEGGEQPGPDDDVPPPMDFNEPEPQFGYEYVPAEGAVPNQVIMNALQMSILKQIQEKQSEYTGDTNESGEKHGFGKMVYLDGSMYEG